jgi:putative ABC transport system permease protein
VVKDFVNDDGSKLPDATTPPAIGAAIQTDSPEIEHVARLMPGWGNKFFVRNGEKKFIEENIYKADSSIFDVFTFKFLKGDPKTALQPPNAIVLTESAANKYFGKENPIGKTLEVDDWDPQIVTAIIKDVPENSHFKFDLLAPLRFRGRDGNPININTIWGWYNYYTYIKLKPNANIQQVDKKIREVFKKNQPENNNYFYSQALTSIHLNSNLKWELRANSDRIYVYIFGVVALFILIIGCINYINLTTARSSLRAKEIGIRKVSGAVKTSLVGQFLAESVLVAMLSGILSLCIAELLLPGINLVTQKHLVLLGHPNILLLATVLIFSMVIGLAAGLYPAFYLSSFQPVKVLKGTALGINARFSLRKVLVVIQFTISIALIIGTLVVAQQIKFIQNAKLGLNKDHIIMINDIGYLNRSERQSIKNNILQVAGVKSAAATDGIVGGQNWTNSLRRKGSTNSQLVNFLNIDNDYLKTLDIELKEGRSFSKEFPSDTADAIILNETAVKQLGVPEPVLGQQIVWDESDDTVIYAKVVGVVKDFHFTSLKNEIKPFAFVTDNNRQWYLTVKLNGADMQKTIQQIQSVWEKQVKSRPFQYFFLDETYGKLYKAEQNFKTIFFYITAVAIFIACLGLFGLSAFTIAQRTKEIGIRKVLGASVSGIVRMLSGDFIKLVFIAAIIALPIAWWVMHQWLLDFVYRVNIGWWVFVTAIALSLLIALATISFQAIKAAISNPVKSLRTE